LEVLLKTMPVGAADPSAGGPGMVTMSDCKAPVLL